MESTPAQRWPRLARHTVHCLLRAARLARQLPVDDRRRAAAVQRAARAALTSVAVRPVQVDWTPRGGALLGVPFAVGPADAPTLAAMLGASCSQLTLHSDLTARSIERLVHWLARPASKRLPELPGVHCAAPDARPAAAPSRADEDQATATIYWCGLPDPEPRFAALGERLRRELGVRRELELRRELADRTERPD